MMQEAEGEIKMPSFGKDIKLVILDASFQGTQRGDSFAAFHCL